MKWLHNLLKGASLAGALFVFQACYGVPQASPNEEYETDSLSVSLPSPSDEEVVVDATAGELSETPTIQ